MPTGYTSKLYDGDQSFKDFVMECSKAFFWAFKEAPPNANFEETLSEWQQNEIRSKKQKISELKREVAKYEKMDPKGVLSELKESRARRAREEAKSGPKRKARGERFQKMYDRVKAMKVPQDNEFLKNLKKFMLSQLEHDLPNEEIEKFHAEEAKEPTMEDAKEFLQHELSYARRQLLDEEKELIEYEQAIKDQKKALRMLMEILEES